MKPRSTVAPGPAQFESAPRALAFAVLAAILTMFAVTNTVMGQPEGVDRLVFDTFGLVEVPTFARHLRP